GPDDPADHPLPTIEPQALAVGQHADDHPEIVPVVDLGAGERLAVVAVEGDPPRVAGDAPDGEVLGAGRDGAGHGGLLGRRVRPPDPISGRSRAPHARLTANGAATRPGE